MARIRLRGFIQRTKKDNLTGSVDEFLTHIVDSHFVHESD